MAESFESMWDIEVRRLAEQVANECTTDSLVNHYVSQMIYYVAHDLADGRVPFTRLFPCVGLLNDDDYYDDMFGGKETEETELMRELGAKLKELQAVLVAMVVPE